MRNEKKCATRCGRRAESGKDLCAQCAERTTMKRSTTTKRRAAKAATFPAELTAVPEGATPLEVTDVVDRCYEVVVGDAPPSRYGFESIGDAEHVLDRSTGPEGKAALARARAIVAERPDHATPPAVAAAAAVLDPVGPDLDLDDAPPAADPDPAAPEAPVDAVMPDVSSPQSTGPGTLSQVEAAPTGEVVQAASTLLNGAISQLQASAQAVAVTANTPAVTREARRAQLLAMTDAEVRAHLVALRGGRPLPAYMAGRKQGEVVFNILDVEARAGLVPAAPSRSPGSRSASPKPKKGEKAHAARRFAGAVAAVRSLFGETVATLDLQPHEDVTVALAKVEQFAAYCVERSAAAIAAAAAPERAPRAPKTPPSPIEAGCTADIAPAHASDYADVLHAHQMLGLKVGPVVRGFARCTTADGDLLPRVPVGHLVRAA